MKKVAAFLAGSALMLVTASAMATTLNPYLDRPVTVGTAAAGENSLQTELDNIFGTGNVNVSNQLNVGMFKLSTPGSKVITPQFQFEWTGNASTQNVGIFGWNGSTPVLAQIFAGAHDAGDFATIAWTTKTSGFITAVDMDGLVPPIPTPFSGISRDFFGFYFQPNGSTNPTYYTVDSLNNDGLARVLGFDGYAAGMHNSGVAFVYEDGTDFDYQDAGFFVESIEPVPEPGTMLLVGTGLLCLAIYGKRRRNG